MGEIVNVQHVGGSGGAQHVPKNHSEPLGLVDSGSMTSLLTSKGKTIHKIYIE